MDIGERKVKSKITNLQVPYQLANQKFIKKSKYQRDIQTQKSGGFKAKIRGLQLVRCT